MKPHKILSTLLIIATVCLPTTIACGQDDNYPDTQKLEIPFTPPEQALAAMQLPEGFSATLFAHEPDVHQPIAVTVDERGRLWVVECYTYSDSKQNYDLSLKDRIVIFEDTDHDGVHDVRKVFWDQGSKLTGIEVGLGGVWVTAAPNFMFIPDANKDDIPDSEPTILLNGFEGDVIRHNIVNGLRWGPDGWLYGRHGIQATSTVGIPGATESQRRSINCCIWRYHPTVHRFEVVAEGGTNPWGFDYDEHGEMFMINTVIGHLFHVVPGARFRRMYGAHFNPYTYQVIEQTADHFHWHTSEEHWAVTKRDGMSDATDLAGGGHAHTGLMIYQGNNWPREYHNSLFTSNFHGRRLNMDSIHRQGNSYVAHHGSDFMKTTDPWFRGIESVCGPDGAVFLLDWSDIGECHENDGIHRTSGRIFKISYGTVAKPTIVNLNKLNNDELIDLQFHDNDWHARTARRLLQERALAGDSASIVQSLQATYDRATAENAAIPHRLRLMWAEYSCGGFEFQTALQRLQDSDEHIRAWTVRMISDGLQDIPQNVIDRLITQATTDSSALVRLYLASALGRLNNSNRMKMAQALASFESDSTDRVQPHLIWFGLEPAVLDDPTHALQVASAARIPLLRENIVRRLTEEFKTDSIDQIMRWLADEQNVQTRTEILRGMSKALEGWVQATAPTQWGSLSTEFGNSDSQEIRSLAQKLDVVFGNGRAIAELKALVSNRSADLKSRLNAIELVSPKLPSAELFTLLKKEINDKSVATQVTRSFVHCEEAQVAEVILNRFRVLKPRGKTAAINTLVARKEWATVLLDAIGQAKIEKSFVSAWHARQIMNFSDPGLDQQLQQVWGTIRETAADKLARVDELRQQLTRDDLPTPNLENGKLHYTKHCASCHTLNGAGGNIGPDLTGSDRGNLNYLLENLVDPSASIAESYRSSVIQLTDGRLLTGVVVEENERTLKLQTEEELVSIDLLNIDQRRLTKLSLMPDGLLDPLNEDQLRDLFGYLRDK